MHIIKALGYSLKGLRFAWQETAFRQEVFLSIIIIPAACFLGHSSIIRVILTLSWLLVLVAELFNSAIEAVVDRISTEQHPLSGQAKDLASAGVFVMILICIITWGCLLC